MHHSNPNNSAASSPCLVCGHENFVPHLQDLLRCTNCGFVTAQVDPNLDVRNIYETDYFTGGEYLDYCSDEAFFKKNFRRRLNDLLHYRRSGKLLELGAAYGFFADLAREYFDVVGYELNPQAVQHARNQLGLDIRNEDFLQGDSHKIGGPFDITVMWDLVEHLPRPDLYIQRVSELTQPGGLLFLTTGDISSLLARLRGRKWRLIHPPSHLHYFNRQTITTLLANHGFKTVNIKHVGTARSLRQIAYSVLVLGLHRPTVYQKIASRLPPSAGVTINTFDIMQVTAKKI